MSDTTPGHHLDLSGWSVRFHVNPPAIPESFEARLIGNCLLICADCRDVMPVKADAVISDPPYGMGVDTDNSRFSGGNAASVSRRGNGVGTGNAAPVLHDDEPFDPSPWLDYPAVVLFGSNHFGQRLPVGTTLIWLKRNDSAFGSFLSDAEVAWMKGGHGVYAKRDLSITAEALTRVHPCQKPVSVMAWVMERAKVPMGALVLDPYMGSGTTGIACIRTGRSFIGIEKCPVHFEAACDRIAAEVAQPLLIPPAPPREKPPEHPSLL